MSTSIYDVMERVGGALAGGGGREAAGYLEDPANTVERLNALPEPTEAGRTVRGFVEVRPARCRCRFCDRCSHSAGHELRRRLAKVLGTFVRPFMVTLTIDPSLYASPREALEDVQGRRLVGEFVRALLAREADERVDETDHRPTPKYSGRSVRMHSARWACVVEFQANGMPHWHLLLDASFIDHRTLAECWDKFRPYLAPRWRKWSPWNLAGKRPASFKGQRPKFGGVRFTRPKGFVSATHAANYVTKYVTKPPRDGWPAWVLDMERVRRFSTSRGFWGEDTPERKERERPREGTRRTIRERVAGCCQTCNVFEVNVNTETGETQKPKFLGRIRAAPPEAFKRIGEGERVRSYLVVSSPGGIAAVMRAVFLPPDPPNLPDMFAADREAEAARVIERMRERDAEHIEGIVWSLGRLATTQSV